MKRSLVLLTSLFLSILLCTATLSALDASAIETDKESAEEGLEELVPGTDYDAWFLDATGYVTVTDYFGAYAIAPLDDTLYLGFGRARPGEANGALFAGYDGTALQAIYQPTEQGFIDMEVVSGTIFFPGPDPCCDDNWDWGNSYVYTESHPVVKYRNLPNVIHSWGIWFDQGEGTLYTAVSSHLGDYQTWTGELFSSTTRARSWQRVADRDDGIGQQRTYDVQGLEDELFVTWNDVYQEPCGLARSGDGGETWTRLPDLETACRTRLFTYQEQLLALRDDRAALYSVDAGGRIITHTLPGFTVTAWAYNPFTVDGDGYLYTVAADGRVMRTRNLHAWQAVAETDLDLITIAYWPEKDWLVLGDRGQEARLWKFDLNALSPSPDLAKNVILLIADGWGAKHIEAMNSYSGGAPAYQSWAKYWMSTYPAGGNYDPARAWTDFDYLIENTTDSAAAATAMYTGRKTANGRISSSISGTARLDAISEKARDMGKAAGAVSSVYVSHATPGAWMAHNTARGNGYAIADEGYWGDPNTTGTISDHVDYGGGLGVTLPPLDVVIGAGHPAWNDNYVNGAQRDKLASESGGPGAFVFVERIAGQADGGERLLAAAELVTTTRLAGLFGGSGGNLEYRLADGAGAVPENPTLAEMTTAALAVLGRSPEGFMLLVEGGAVDWASHRNDMDRMVGEMIGFNQAVTAVIDWIEDPATEANWGNTLVIVSGDHETGYLTAAPGVFPDQSLGPVSETTLAAEQVISGTARRASWDDTDGDVVIDEGEAVYWAWNSGGHTNSLVPLYARGPGATLFEAYAVGDDPVRGAYLDNTAVFHVMEAVLRYGNYLPLITR